MSSDMNRLLYSDCFGTHYLTRSKRELRIMFATDVSIRSRFPFYGYSSANTTDLYP